MRGNVMCERKFKVGDRVKGIKGSHYVITDECMTLGEVIKLDFDYDGKFMMVKILEHSNNAFVGRQYRVCNSSKYFELVKEQSVVIYKNGNEVFAKNKITGEIAKATCHDDDEFDFAIGAKLALERLLPTKKVEEPEQPKFKPGDIVAIKNNDYGIPTGTLGEIVLSPKSNDGFYTVDFKFKYRDTHRCAGLEGQTGLWLLEHIIEKVN